ncbi:MAG: hypothetical protein D3916_17680, partial [Candidatus Electrothrix sp. MAN1_4]|nr:hypothetical protein [Candidatus Electrothrix sp. MAN1_4]
MGLINYSNLQDNDFKNMTNLSIEYLRFTAFWEGIEKNKGVFDWRRMDKIISLAKKNGIKPVLVIGYIPKYLDTNNRTMDTFKKERYIFFLEKVVRRYPYIKFYEIWNEPDIKIFWKYSYNEYINLIKISYDIIKKNNKNAKVINGGLAKKNISYVQKLLNDTDGYIDFLSIHFYYHWNKPKYDQINYIRNVCKLSKKYKLKVWITETGIPSGGYNNYSYKRIGYYPSSQARELIKLFVLLKSIKEHDVIEQIFLYS